MKNLSDKFGELDKAFTWQMNRHPEGDFSVTLWTMPQIGPRALCSFETERHANMHDAVDEAIDLLKEHLSDCAIC